MNCPHCGNLVPEKNYRCPTCHKVVQETMDPTAFRDKTSKRPTLNATSFIFALIVIGIAILAVAIYFKSQGKKTSSSATPMESVAPNTVASNPTATDLQPETQSNPGNLKMGYVINEKTPGQEIQIQEFVQGDQITIFDFYSEYCPPCVAMSPWLKELDNMRDDIVIFKIDINRPGYTGIDWGSPVAQQYNLKSIPHLVIFRIDGILDMEGAPAYDRVVQLLKSEGIVK